MSTVTYTTRPCVVCHESTDMEIPADGFDAWKDRGLYVQDAFPEMSPDEREMLISGTHPACWEALFAEE